jgi:hypothetical protein
LAGELNRAVQQLPLATRRAMLSAAVSGELIAGAYTDRHGRVCPMLAAHRQGARFPVGDFPRAWDAFARARRPRPATPREVAVLRAMLEETVAEPLVRVAEPLVPVPPSVHPLPPAHAPTAGRVGCAA